MLKPIAGDHSEKYLGNSSEQLSKTLA